MPETITVPQPLLSVESFTRKDFIRIYGAETGQTLENAVIYALRKLLENGTVQRAGWNRYSAQGQKRRYQNHYTEETVKAVNQIEQEYDGLSFRVFELFQLNPLMNHQIAHNTIFIYVENGFTDYVFDSLKKVFPGRVMLKPSVEEYYRYFVDNGIVIGKLVSETPKGEGVFWHSNLETVLVDIVADKLLRHIVPIGEYRNIFTESFSRYLLDEKSMCRYARRRGAEKKICGFLEQTFPGHRRG